MKAKFPPLAFMNVPNGITSLSLGMGFVFALLILGNRLAIAVFLYATILLFDRLDGVAARRLNMESEFGKELDSLVDLLNFSFLPPFTAYVCGFDEWYQVPLLILFLLSGAWRLANYNVSGLKVVDDKKCFTGLCTTHAAAFFAVLFTLHILLDLRIGYWASFYFPIFAVLQVSGFSYDKNGLLTKSVYVLVSLCLLSLLILR